MPLTRQGSYLQVFFNVVFRQRGDFLFISGGEVRIEISPSMIGPTKVTSVFTHSPL